MPQDRAMRAFVIHLGIFVLVVSLLAAINLYRNPDHIWFIWVLAGWGIGVAAHDLALLLQRTGRKEAIFTDARVRGFFIHLFRLCRGECPADRGQSHVYADLLLVPLSAYRVGSAASGPRLRHLLSQARQRSIVQRSNRS